MTAILSTSESHFTFATENTVPVMNAGSKSSDHLAIGTSLRKGKYVIKKYLGHGGFGMIYQASLRSSGSRVVIKELFPSRYCYRDVRGQVCSRQSSEAAMNFAYARRSFASESSHIMNCVHDSIIRAYDSFMENNTMYYVMEYVDGITLAQELRRSGALSVSRAVDIIISIAGAVGYMHRCGMVHLDIKPSNIMVSRSDRAVLIDFGSSRIASEKDGSDDCPLILSSGYYSEKMFGRSFEDSRFFRQMDVYALGTTLYQLVTDHLPSSYDSNDYCLPEMLEMIIRKALDDSDKGYHSVSEFITDLRCFRRTLGVDIQSRNTYRTCA